MVLSGLILVVSAALFFFYSWAVVQRVLHHAPYRG